MKGRLGLLDGMPKEFLCGKLKELKITGNCIRIITMSGEYDCYTYNIKKDHLVAITRTYDGTSFIFKDLCVTIKDISTFRDQINSIIKSELEGTVEPSTDLLGINT